MSTLAQLVANSLWFAYDAIDHYKTENLPKSQLKVLTQNIGVLLNIERRVENCIDDFLSISCLTYEQYIYFLTHEVFVEVDNGNVAYRELEHHHSQLESAFWLLVRPNLQKRHQPILSDVASYKIFRVFSLLADRETEEEQSTKVILSKWEVKEVTHNLIVELGGEFDEIDFDHLCSSISKFTLPVFLTFLESRYLHDVEGPAIESAVDEIYQLYIEQILEKGKMFQKVGFAPIWFPREIELLPWELRLSRSSNNLKDISTRPPRKLLIKLNKKTKFEAIPDVPGERACRFSVRSDDKILHLAAPDHRTKSRWLRSLEAAIENSEESLPYQKLLSGLRKQCKLSEEEKILEEKIRRLSQADIIEQTQAELQNEKQARAEAEKHLQEEAQARLNEEKRVQELTTLRQELEKLLEQETQAKRDEEIVRTLQARVLTEEWEKREELERLQKEQLSLLEEEKKKRETFESVQQEKEAQLKEAQRKLRQLEIERLKLDQELRNAREKIVNSERGKEIVEARLKVKQRKPPIRTFSLKTLKSQKRPAPLRSSSFNMHGYSRTISLSSSTLRTETPSITHSETDPNIEDNHNSESSEHSPNSTSSRLRLVENELVSNHRLEEFHEDINDDTSND